MEKLEKKVSIIILIVVVAASLFLTLVGFISDGCCRIFSKA